MYTTEQCNYLKNNVNNTPYNVLTDMFNKRFNECKTTTAISRKCFVMGLKNNVSTTFKKGESPWNKGEKFDAGGRSKETRFKKGEKPINTLKIGSERIGRNGYIEIKVGDLNVWKFKHHIVWERSANKKIPDGYIVMFCDKNRFNFNEDNLICVSRGVLGVMNKKGRIDKNPYVTKCYSTLTELEMLTRKMEG